MCDGAGGCEIGSGKREGFCSAGNPVALLVNGWALSVAADMRSANSAADVCPVGPVGPVVCAKAVINPFGDNASNKTVNLKCDSALANHAKTSFTRLC